MLKSVLNEIGRQEEKSKTGKSEINKIFKDSDYIQKNIEAYEYVKTRDYPNAKVCFEECVDISRELEDDYKFADSLTNYGITQYYTGRIRESLESLESAFRLSVVSISSQEQNKLLLHFKILSNLVLTFLSIGRTNEALSYSTNIIETLNKIKTDKLFYLKQVLFIFFRVESIVNYVQTYHKYSFNLKDKIQVTNENKDTHGLIINRILFYMHKFLRENDLDSWIQCLSEEAENFKLLKDYNGFVFALYNQYVSLYVKNPELNAQSSKRKISSLNKVLIGDKEKSQSSTFQEKSPEKILNEMKEKLSTSREIYKQLYEMEAKLLLNGATSNDVSLDDIDLVRKSQISSKVFLSLFLRHAKRCLSNLEDSSNISSLGNKNYLKQMISQIELTASLIEQNKLNFNSVQLYKLDPDFYNSITTLFENLFLIRYKFIMKQFFNEFKYETLGYRSKEDLRYIKDLKYENFEKKNFQVICEGLILTKINFSTSGKKEHFYKLEPSNNSLRIYQKKNDKSFKTLFIKDVKKFSYGIISENLKKRFKSMKASQLNAPWLFFSIISKKRSLDLYLEEHQLISWFYGIKKLLRDSDHSYKLISVNNFLLTRTKFKLLQKLKEENIANVDPKYKILVSEILSGDQRVGKTCIVGQLIKQYFNNTYQTTLGVDYNTYEVKIKDSNYAVQLHILDCTGFSAFNEVVMSQIADVNFLLYVYDATNLESFQTVKLWKEAVKGSLENKRCVEYLVGNKNDLEKKLVVDETSIKNMASLYNFKTFSISAELFLSIAEEVNNSYLNFISLIKKIA